MVDTFYHITLQGNLIRCNASSCHKKMKSRMLLNLSDSLFVSNKCEVDTIALKYLIVKLES